MNIDYDDPEELEICPFDPVHRIGILFKEEKISLPSGEVSEGNTILVL